MAIFDDIPRTSPATNPSGGGVSTSLGSPTGPLVPYAAGIVAMEGQASIDERKRTAEAANARPVIQGLAGHVRSQWRAARDAKRQDIEPRMLQSLRQRRGDYDPDIRAEIDKQGGSQIYMMLTANKCRSAAAWLRDAMLGTAQEKPWTIRPTPRAVLPPALTQSAYNIALQEANAFTAATGLPVGEEYVTRDAALLYDRLSAAVKKQAEERMARMEKKMEDQLAEGGFHRALTEFINDLVTFPAAIIKGPVVRKKKKLAWENDKPVPTDQLGLEWTRVDPFNAYPAAHAANVDDGDFIERHKLSRAALAEMKGVEGYNNAAIDAVLEQYGRGGLSSWLEIDIEKAAAEGRSTTSISENTGGLIDALQFWGSVQGQMLIDWGMPANQIADPLKDYPCEVWLIGEWCIKAVLNPDPLGRKPYFKSCYEEVPGAFWGNAPPDLCRDAQSQCNTAARAIANNMSIGSGPQVAYNVDRLPPGYNLTTLYPWKVHQYNSDPFGSTAKAVEFFMPPMVAGELITIYRFFSEMADEHTGIPRYMTGDAAGQGGALRTSSGMSMLMQNAGKSIKQVIANVDSTLIEPCIERLWFHNMVYSDDPELKGDISVVARGANSLIVKETQQQRINEFLQLALTNPIVNEIVGEEAIAAMLRVAAKNLDMDTDQIVPPPEVIRKRIANALAQQQAAMQQQQQFALAMATAPSQELKVERGENGEMLGMTVIDKQPAILDRAMGGSAGAPPVPTGLSPQSGANPAATMSKPGQNAVDVFSPRRVH